MSGTELEVARAVTGLRQLFHEDTDPIVRRGVRIAGARQLVQGAATIALPELRPLGVLTDVAHAASMLVVAVASRRLRRPALAQAGLAAALVVAELWVIGDIMPPGRVRAARRSSRSPGRRPRT
jgi:hypothetical protein